MRGESRSGRSGKDEGGGDGVGKGRGSGTFMREERRE
jgi:hypothetical protein